MKNFTTKSKNKISWKLGYVGLIAYVAFCLCAAKTFAAQNLLQKYQQDLTQVEDYLNNISKLSANFTQQSEGKLVKGKFFLLRNKESAGKMRIEYLAEPKILIVVNGSVLSYVDIELDETSRLGTNTTPASFLTRPNISFSAKDVEITGVQKSSNRIKISLMKKNRKEAGEFSLIFDLNPLSFVKMEVKNDLGSVVGVTLHEIDFNSEISDKLFVIKNKSLQ
jgi:outer membrane lipoprotein-sorting protein